MISGATPSPEFLKIALFVELVNRLGEARLRVSGSSMLPSIWAGDVLAVQQCGTRDAHVGDVVVFVRDGRLFAHRVVAEDASSLVTQGDAMLSQDPPVTDAELLGRVVSVSRAGKSVPVSANVSVSGRLMTTLVRRSSLAGRILQRGYRLRRRGAA